MNHLPSYDYKTTLLEDVFEPIVDSYCPVVVIDFKVYAHSINRYAELASEIARNPEELKNIFKAMWAYKLNRGPDMLKPLPFVGFVVDDKKGKLSEEFSEASVSGAGYWRHIEAYKLDLAEYKGGRGEKPPLFPIIEQAGYEYIKSQGSTFAYFVKEFFEADDIAGHISRLRRNASPTTPLGQRQIILSTVDGDWQGLVSDPDCIIWANTGPWLPRLRSEREVCDYYLRKESLFIDTAQGCYEVKEQVGDAGDNLAPGTPLRFFDLYNEDTHWRFTEQDTKTILEVLNTSTPSNREDHLNSARSFLLARGLFLPENGVTEQSYKESYFARAQKDRNKKIVDGLSGKNKALCLGILEQEELFEKCKRLALEDEDLKTKIKEETQKMSLCKEKEDKKCIKELRVIIKAMKDLRESIKTQLSTFITPP